MSDLANRIRQWLGDTEATVDMPQGKAGMVEGDSHNLALDPAETKELATSKRQNTDSLAERYLRPKDQAEYDRRQAALKEHNSSFLSRALGGLAPLPVQAAMGASTINKGLESKFGSLDMLPKGPGAEEAPPQGEGGHPAWGNPQAQSGQRPVASGSAPTAVPAQGAPGGGGGSGGGPAAPSMSDEARAKMAAGDVGVRPELQSAADASKKTLADAQNSMQGRINGMEDAMLEQREAGRRVAAAENDKARELNARLSQRMADADEMHARLKQRADIDPNAYWKSHPMGEAGGRISATFGLFMSNLAGPEYAQRYSDNLNKNIDRFVDTQAKSYQNNLGMSRERRAEWDDRMRLFGDIEQAKISAKMQDLEAAKSYFNSNMSLAKTDEAKMRLATAADAIDMKLAESRQEMAEKVSQQQYKIIDEREKRARAAAAAAAAQARAEKRSDLEHDRKKELLQMSLDSKEGIASMRHGGGAGGVGGGAGLTPKQRLDFVKNYGTEISDSDQAMTVINRAEGAMSKYRPDQQVPGFGTRDVVASKFQGVGLDKWLMSDAGFENRQNVMSAVFARIKQLSGSSYTDKELVKQAEAMIGSGKASQVQQGIAALRELEQQHRDGVEAKYHPSIVQEYQTNKKANAARK